MVGAAAARPSGAGAEGRRHGVEAVQALNRQPTIAEIATAVGADEEQVLEALEAHRAYSATSLQAPRGGDSGDDDTLGDTLGADEHGFARAEQRATLQRLMRVLTPRERIIVHLRFEHDLTQAEIGEKVGVSQMQVSRILRQSLGRLRYAANRASKA